VVDGQYRLFVRSERLVLDEFRELQARTAEQQDIACLQTAAGVSYFPSNENTRSDWLKRVPTGRCELANSLENVPLWALRRVISAGMEWVAFHDPPNAAQ
jgi:hypothetical protein